MRISRIVGAAALGIVTVGVAQPAFGFANPLAYYTPSAPLTAYDDGVAQAQMYGLFLVTNATYLHNDTYQRDPRPGGDRVFERTQFNYYMFSAAHNAKIWIEKSEQQSAKTDTSAWYWQYDRHAFPGSAEKGQMETQVCEDHGWLPDPCSPWPRWTTDL